MNAGTRPDLPEEDVDDLPAVTRFVERLARAVGPSPSFTGPPSPAPPSPSAVAYAAPDQADAFCAAGRRAVATYPGPVGELVARELEAAAGFGFRLGTDALLVRLVDHLLGQRDTATMT